jgi:ligand-binding sensor domain-containing protein
MYRPRPSAPRFCQKMAGFRTALCILASLSMSVPARALDPAKEVTQYRLDTWGAKEGLPAQTIRDIKQSREGYIWIATQTLVRFDGVKFTVVDTTTGKGTVPAISSLAASPDGGLWVGTRNTGVLRYRDGNVTPSKRPLDLLRGPAILTSRDGALWAVARDGLARFRDGRVDLQLAERAEVRALVETPDGAVYAGLWDAPRGALLRVRDGELTYFDKADGLSDRHVTALCAGRDGTLWIGTRNGLNAFKDGRFRTYGEREGLLNEVVSALLEDRDGNLWVGTGGGLYRFRDGRFSALHKADGLADEHVSALFEDDEGGLWVGGRGIVGRLRDTSVTMYTAREGLSVDAINETVSAREGGVWVGTYGGGVSRLKDGRFTNFGRAAGLTDLSVGAMYEARDGTLWFGVGSNELMTLRNGRARAFDTGGRYVLAIHEDQQGLLVALRDAGLFRLENGRLVRYRTPAGEEVKEGYLRAILIGRNGTMWIGDGGIARIEGGRRVQPKEHQFSRLVYSLHEDADGVIWVAAGLGLMRLKNDRLTRFENQPYLWGNPLASILEDASGHLWINSDKGILRVAKSELDDVAEGRRERATVRVFGPQDGLSLEEMRAPTVQRASRTADGRLWFPTPLGLARIDPAHLVRDAKAPPVVIEQVVIDGKAARASNALVIPAGAQKVELHFSALSYTLSERATFRYWLEGFDAEWVDGGTKRMANYTKLPPGAYRFHVRAANSEGVWNETGATLAFSQQPRFHQTVTFRLACIVGVGVAIFSMHRLRVRQLKARERELSRKVQEAMAQVKVLRGLMPICSNCHKVRTDQGAYVNMEAYLQENTDAELSHGVCPDCITLLYPDYARATGSPGT